MLADCPHNALLGHRQLIQLDTHGRRDRVCNGGHCRDQGHLTDALGTIGSLGIGLTNEAAEHILVVGHIQHGRDLVVTVVPVDDLALSVEHGLLKDRLADAHNEGAVHLAVDSLLVQNLASIVIAQRLQYTDVAGLNIDGDLHTQCAVGVVGRRLTLAGFLVHGSFLVGEGNLAHDLAQLRHPAAVVEKRLRVEIRKGVQTIQYQVVTLLTTNGQAPFVTVFMYLNEAKNEQEKKDLAVIIEEVLEQRRKGVKNEKGVWVTPAFPKLIYVLEEDNIHEGDKYYYLTKLAAKCTAKRMVPDYISEKIMLEKKIDKNGEGHCYTCMGCRSFLTPYLDEDGKPKYYGRFNQGVVTVNLVDIGLSANKNMDEFWKIFDERIELCHRALQCRHERLSGTVSDVAPILWQYGALLRLKKGEKIDKYLHGGYSTLSLGYAGLWECVYSLIGKKLTEPEGEKLGLEIMEKLNEYTSKWKAEENIDYSIYGTPLESTTYKFAKCLQKRFGVVEGVTDKGYITNSYHIHVTEKINAFDKLAFEAKFQALSPGGAISYVEVPDMQDNIEAVLEIMKFIYDHIMYAELNTKSDYCQKCGWDGEIEIKEHDGKLIWTCPQCGNTDQDTMNVARRTCGYIGTQFWNQGRTQEIKERVMHL